MSDDRVFLKCAWRLIPFMVLLYLVSFIDRANAGFAALTMNKDLGLLLAALLMLALRRAVVPRPAIIFVKPADA